MDRRAPAVSGGEHNEEVRRARGGGRPFRTEDQEGLVRGHGWKIRYEPSGAIAGATLLPTLENGATTGCDQVSPCLWEIMIWREVPVRRVNRTVFPSGVKAGDASFWGPHCASAENIVGAGDGGGVVCANAAQGDRTKARARLSFFMRVP